MEEGLTIFSLGGERPLIIQNNRGDSSGEGRPNDWGMLAYGMSGSPRELTFDVYNCKQEEVKGKIARLGRGRDRGGRGCQSQLGRNDPTTSTPTS